MYNIGGGGGVLIYPCLSHLTVDRTQLSERSTGPSPNGNTSNIGAFMVFFSKDCTQFPRLPYSLPDCRLPYSLPDWIFVATLNILV